jgi:type I restriction enzyme, S subunit
VKAGWDNANLGDLCRIELGSTPARKDQRLWDKERRTGNVWLSIADMPMGIHANAVDSKEYVADVAASKMKLVPKGTLLVSFKLTLGRLVYAGRDLFTNEAIAALLDVDESRINLSFLYWSLTAFDWDKAAEGDHKIKGKTLNKAKLKQLPIPLPPLEEQQRIVAILDEAFEGLDRAKENAEANLANARELVEVVVREELDAATNASGTMRLEEACAFKNGFAFKSGKFRDSGTPVVRISNIQSGQLDLQDVRCVREDEHSEDLSRYFIEPGDLLIAMSGGTTGKIGFNTSGRRLLQNQRVGRFVPGPDLNADYLYFVLSTKVEEHLAISAGSAQPNLSTRQILDIKLPRLALSQQKAMIKRLRTLQGRQSQLSVQYQAGLTETRQLRQSLLAKAFAGELT